jgi:hypothetical protein
MKIGKKTSSFIPHPSSFIFKGDCLTMTENGFEPEILAFCCRHCAYAAADLAGGLRLDYPASVKVVELPCTGKFDVLYALRAFEDGADGIMVAG